MYDINNLQYIQILRKSLLDLATLVGDRTTDNDDLLFSQ